MGQLSHRVDIPFPLFDADNHLYEPPEALTKYLPKEYKDVVQYVEINGRTKIAIKGQISNYIPNPTFSVVAKPGAWEEYFKFGNPDGKSKRELFGEPMRAIRVEQDRPERRDGNKNVLLFDVFSGSQRYVFAFVVDKREKIHLDLGDFDAWKIVPNVWYVSDGEIRSEARNTVLWISADERHLPLRIQAQAYIGYVRADLIKIDGKGGVESAQN